MTGLLLAAVVAGLAGWSAWAHRHILIAHARQARAAWAWRGYTPGRTWRRVNGRWERS